MGRYLRPEIGVLALVLVGAGLAFLGGEMVGLHVETLLDVRSMAREALMDPWVLATILVIYVVVMAVPFVPAAEIGFALLLVLGAEAAGFVYVATVAALTLAFCVGRRVPETTLEAFFGRIGFTRVETLLRETRLLDPTNRSRHIAGRLPTRWLPFLMRRPILALAVLINTPGNTLIGGGGGIAMVTGLSRIIGLRDFILCVALAVAPVPLVFLLAG